MSATTVPTATLRICVDCLMMLANGELGQGDEAAETAHVDAMSRLWGPMVDISLGCVDEDCPDDGDECGPLSRYGLGPVMTCPKCGRPLAEWPIYRGPRCSPKSWVTCIRQDPS